MGFITSMKKSSIGYWTIALVTIAVAGIGGLLTTSGMAWYQTLLLPRWTPSGMVIGAVWTILFILTMIAAMLVWRDAPHQRVRFKITLLLFCANALLNVLWSYLFFVQNLLSSAVLEAAVLGASVIALVIFIRPFSKTAALLLLPYAAWVAFATYLSYVIFMMN